MTQKIIYGIITFDSSGNILPNGYKGSGYTVIRDDKGVYTVTFDKAFNDIPSVTVTEIQNGNDDNTGTSSDNYNGVGPRCNAVLINITTRTFRYITGNNSGDKEDRMASFMAIGEADDE